MVSICYAEIGELYYNPEKLLEPKPQKLTGKSWEMESTYHKKDLGTSNAVVSFTGEIISF